MLRGHAVVHVLVGGVHRQIDLQQMSHGEDSGDQVHELRRRSQGKEQLLARTLDELATTDRELASLQSAAIVGLQEIRAAWGDIPTHPGVAIRGEGVIETFRDLMRLTYRHLDAKHRFAEKFGVSEDDFLKGVLQPFGGR